MQAVVYLALVRKFKTEHQKINRLQELRSAAGF